MGSEAPERAADERVRRLQRALALLFGVCLTLLATVGFYAWSYGAPPVLSWLGGGDRQDELRESLRDGELRREVLPELVAAAGGIFDSHPDPDVGRVLQPMLDGKPFFDVAVHSNRFGMRERDYAIPKPEGVTRVVLLGDSFVFGFRLEADERMGVFLERYLRESSQSAEGTIECLHLGVGSWNAIAEAQFVRRQLSLLQPDLVVQLTVRNDLDDNTGVRGFGGRASFSPQYSRRTDALLTSTYPMRYFRSAPNNVLLEAIDWESRQRYYEMSWDMRHLADSLERTGARYLLIAHWQNYNPKLRRAIQRNLPGERVLYLPSTFLASSDYWVSEEDSHWNARGNEEFARLLYGLVRARGLLPDLELRPWPEADELAARVSAEGHEEAFAEQSERYWSHRRDVRAELDFTAVDAQLLTHVHTGVDLEGRAGPYASIVLQGPADGELHLRGRGLERPELEGAVVEVFVDQVRLDKIELSAGEPFERSWPLPEAVQHRPYQNVRFVTNDWAYTGSELRHCVSFQLESLAVRARE